MLTKLSFKARNSLSIHYIGLRALRLIIFTFFSLNQFVITDVRFKGSQFQKRKWNVIFMNRVNLVFRIQTGSNNKL